MAGLAIATTRDRHPAPSRRNPLIAVLEPHNVVLAEIASDLDLDDPQRLWMRVFQPMLHPDRDEGRFIFLEDQIVLAAHDGCFTRDDNPMLGALVMILQG